MRVFDKQVGGSHYKVGIQPIEYILANNLGMCEGNVIKYVTRWKNKGGIEDLKKAIHYLELLIEHTQKKEEIGLALDNLSNPQPIAGFKPSEDLKRLIGKETISSGPCEYQAN